MANGVTKPLQQHIRMTVSAGNFRRFEREQLRTLCDLALQPTSLGSMTAPSSNAIASVRLGSPIPIPAPNRSFLGALDAEAGGL
jgi:hypothetical protein